MHRRASRRASLLPALAATLACTAARAATVQITVQGIRNDRGAVLVALCTRAEFLRPHCTYQGRTPAHPGSVTITLPAIPPGTYAAQAFHDENANGRLDRTLLGLPAEPMGFSNDAPMRFGPPAYKTAAFPVTEPTTQITFTLH